MADVFFTAVNAVVPLVLLIVLGYVLKRIKFLSGDFLKIGNKFVFNVCLPCMLFVNIYDNMNSFAEVPWAGVLYVVIVVFVIFGLGLVTALLTTKKKNRRGVLLQCAFRSNFAIIGLPLVERLGGDAALGGIGSAFSISVLNILALIALTVFAEYNQAESPNGGVQLSIEGLLNDKNSVKNKRGGANGAQSVLLNILKNPLIIGVAAGLLFVAIRELERACCGGRVPFRFDTQLKFLYLCTVDLKAIASPLALVVLGGQFEFSAVKGMTKEIAVGTAWRIVIAPLIGIGGAALINFIAPNLLGLTPQAYPTLVALYATPVAVSSAIMAGQMGGDEQLATQLVVWTSICSILTVFFTVFILMSCGLIIT